MLEVTVVRGEGGERGLEPQPVWSLELVEPMSIQMDTCQAMRAATKSY